MADNPCLASRARNGLSNSQITNRETRDLGSQWALEQFVIIMSIALQSYQFCLTSNP